tara:strand:+ start:171455 stop:173629 length:2175 start_codon:yes stop_codon:yes gene_type:complete
MNKGSVVFDPRQTGVVKRHPDGFGFFIPDNPAVPDVYIPRKSMGSVMSNDRVEVVVRPEPKGDRYRGEILKIIERNIKLVVGQLYRLNGEEGLLHDESHGWGANLKVGNLKDFKVKDKDWVQVEIKSYPGERRGFFGNIVQILGDHADPMTDNMRALAVHGIPPEFTKETLLEAEALPTEVSEEDRKGRKDLRDKPLITIDGQTAKDFDDAILVETNKQGFKLYVAIADVSHYVKPGTHIDKEAYVRGTSTYFPGFVNPMLPEALSNEMCSLKPRVDRLALTAEMQLDFQGHLVSTDVYEAVIYSHARVTYGQAQEIIDGTEVEGLEHVRAEIETARDLAKVLLSKRMKEGSLELDVPETVIEVDETGQPIDIIKSERLFAHRLIEEMMLTANVAMAKFLGEKNVPAIYRIHEEPNEDAIAILRAYLATKGVDMKVGGSLQKRITKALQKFQGKPEAVILSTLALRSMNQAKYSPHNVGHFGLGFSDYVHFTSPIRRYPDLIIHRALKSVVVKNKGYRPPNMDDLESAGTMLSACEQRSVKAERLVDAIKKARFMERHQGETFKGIVSSVTKFGVFVVLRQFNVDGLVKIEELANEYMEFDQEQMCLVGRKSGYTVSIGDEMEVLVANVNIDLGQIDFSLGGDHPKPLKTESKSAEKPNREKRTSRSRNDSKGESRRESRSKSKRRSKKSDSKKGKKKTTGKSKKKKAASGTRAKKRKKNKSNR